MAAPANLSLVYPDRQGVNDILGEAGVKWRLDDDNTGVVSGLEEAVLTRLYSVATAWVRFKLSKYDLSSYPTADNAGHWMVYRWSCIRAAVDCCKRRGNPVIASLNDMYIEASMTLDSIQKGEQTLADVAQFASPSMSLSNMRLSDYYHTRKLRIERPISDQIPTPYQQNRDWVSDTLPEAQP